SMSAIVAPHSVTNSPSTAAARAASDGSSSSGTRFGCRRRSRAAPAYASTLKSTHDATATSRTITATRAGDTTRAHRLRRYVSRAFLLFDDAPLKPVRAGEPRGSFVPRHSRYAVVMAGG